MPEADRLSDRQRALLRTVIDLLIPAGDGFPSASEAGVEPILLREIAGRDPAEFARGLDLLDASAGQRFLEQRRDAQVALLERLQMERPAFFAALRTLVYTIYYGRPATIAAIQRLGWDYHGAPLPAGYALEPWSAEELAAFAAQGRGFYLHTEQVRRVEGPPAVPSSSRGSAPTS